jgi:hypothetical protein
MTVANIYRLLWLPNCIQQANLIFGFSFWPTGCGALFVVTIVATPWLQWQM